LTKQEQRGRPGDPPEVRAERGEGSRPGIDPGLTKNLFYKRKKKTETISSVSEQIQSAEGRQGFPSNKKYEKEETMGGLS